MYKVMTFARIGFTLIVVIVNYKEHKSRTISVPFCSNWDKILGLLKSSICNTLAQVAFFWQLFRENVFSNFWITAHAVFYRYMRLAHHGLINSSTCKEPRNNEYSEFRPEREWFRPEVKRLQSNSKNVNQNVPMYRMKVLKRTSYHFHCWNELRTVKRADM